MLVVSYLLVLQLFHNAGYTENIFVQKHHRPLGLYPFLHFLTYLFRDKSRYYFEFFVLEFRKYPVTHTILIMPTDSHLDPSKFIRSEFFDRIAEPILSTMASFFSKPDFPEFHIDIIRNHEKIIFWVELIELYNTRDTLSRTIHIRRGLQKNHFFS